MIKEVQPKPEQQSAASHTWLEREGLEGAVLTSTPLVRISVYRVNLKMPYSKGTQWI